MNLSHVQFENPFPSVDDADEEGMLAISEFITPELAIAAYVMEFSPGR